MFNRMIDLAEVRAQLGSSSQSLGGSSSSQSKRFHKGCWSNG
jgi:hypothetical protein